jgi:tetratricopeptide (TPR) repeat protein
MGKTDEAFADFNKTIELNPDEDQAWYNRGRILLEQEKYEDAIADFTRSIELLPKEEKYHNRAICLDALGKCQEAIEDFTAAIDTNPQYAESYYSRGLVFTDLKEFEKQLKTFLLL